MENTNDYLRIMLRNQLKPCPFCGKKDKLAIHIPNKDNKCDVACLECGVKIERALGIDIVKAWNTRIHF